jgi:hypothetical protein
MKRSVLLMMAIALVFSSCSVFQGGSKQKSFTGKVKYKIEYPNSNIPAQAQGQLPDNSTLYIKGKKSKTEMISPMMTRNTIKDAEAMNAVTLLEVMGQKYAIEQTKEEIMEERASKDTPELEFTDNTKTIAGYEAKEVIVTPEGKEPYSIYYTPKIGGKAMNFDSHIFKNIDGLPLEFRIENEQFEMKMTATEITEEKVSSDAFDVPDDYKKVTMEELRNMFGG